VSDIITAAQDHELERLTSAVVALMLVVVPACDSQELDVSDSGVFENRGRGIDPHHADGSAPRGSRPIESLREGRNAALLGLPLPQAHASSLALQYTNLFLGLSVGSGREGAERV
jgi:hypothetical protein